MDHVNFFCFPNILLQDKMVVVHIFFVPTFFNSVLDCLPISNIITLYQFITHLEYIIKQSKSMHINNELNRSLKHATIILVYLRFITMQQYLNGNIGMTSHWNGITMEIPLGWQSSEYSKYQQMQPIIKLLKCQHVFCSITIFNFISFVFLD